MRTKDFKDNEYQVTLPELRMILCKYIDTRLLDKKQSYQMMLDCLIELHEKILLNNYIKAVNRNKYIK